jgi:16S rRNA (guanine1516-N2)-methyltransferase
LQPDGLSLVLPDGSKVSANFIDGKTRHRLRTATPRQPLGRAVGADKANRPLTLLDATAGLGRDTAFLASLGHHLIACERNPIVHALLRDGLERARAMKGRPAWITRVELHPGDAAAYLTTTATLPTIDCILLDPMYPPKPKSAKPPKEMQALQSLIGPDEDTEGLLALARSAAPRVALKRPLSAPPLAADVDLQVKSKMVRFDIYRNPAFG